MSDATTLTLGSLVSTPGYSISPDSSTSTDSSSSDSTDASLGDTIVNNLGDILGGSAQLLNAINGKPASQVIVTPPVQTPGILGVNSQNSTWIILLVVMIILVVLFMFFKK